MKLSADLPKAIQESFYFLEDAGVTEFPVNLDLVIASISTNVKVLTYSDHSKERGMSFEECVGLYGEDGVSVYNASNETFLIIYNETKSELRIRFTLAHEIGHIVLGHHYEAGTKILERSELSSIQYGVFESEANWFARNLLEPAPVSIRLLKDYGFETQGWKDGYYIWKIAKDTKKNENLQKNLSPDMYLENAFKISNSAAITRANTLKSEMDKVREGKMDTNYIMSIRHTSRWVCFYCRTPRSRGANYCINCKKKLFVFRTSRNEGFLRIKGTDWKISVCPVCGSDEQDDEASFCKICGQPLTNPCKKNPQHGNHPLARYCRVCAEETVYFNSSYQKRLVKEGKNIEEIKPVKYDQDIKYDKNTYRVIECPRCKNSDFSDNAEYCIICGLELYNPCIPEKIDEDNWGGAIMSEIHRNPANARFCEQCGRETVYFSKQKLLRPYTDILEEIEMKEILG